MGIRFILALMAVLAVVASGCITNPPSEVLVSYNRTGGIAGFDDHLVIYENGTSVISRTTVEGTFVLNKNSLSMLEKELVASNFTSLNESYPASSSGADYMTYEITYKNYTVKAVDTGVPDALEPVIRMLNQIIQTES
ncbi:MAG TPA: hypothetical protein VE134_10225 [Methanomicrobiales archaeon]|nr:hypothetical protein [Methanomicrobiales archaeon]